MKNGMEGKLMSENDGTIHIFLAGDSTVANCPVHEYPMSGWGQVLPKFFNNKVKIINEAKGGASSNTFIEEGRLNKILEKIKVDDYLFIQFGHNDQKSYGTDARTTYKDCLLQFINGANEKGTHPVLITSVQRRSFNNEGKIVNTLGEYPETMRSLAREKDIPLIDLWQKSKTLYESFSVEKSKRLFMWAKPNELTNYPNGIEDNTHFSEFGATEIAKLVIEGIKELQIPLMNYIIHTES